MPNSQDSPNDPETTRERTFVIDALLRCTRSDNLAAPLLGQTGLPGLWVLELGHLGGETWAEWLAHAASMLSENEPLLKRLGTDSTDYTLHVTVAFSEAHAVTIPPVFSHFLASCGITLELYYGPA